MSPLRYGLLAASATISSIPQYYSFSIGLTVRELGITLENTSATLAGFVLFLFGAAFPLATSVATHLRLTWPEFVAWWSDVGFHRASPAVMLAAFAAFAPVTLPIMVGRDDYGTLAVGSLCMAGVGGATARYVSHFRTEGLSSVPNKPALYRDFVALVVTIAATWLAHISRVLMLRARFHVMGTHRTWSSLPTTVAHVGRAAPADPTFSETAISSGWVSGTDSPQKTHGPRVIPEDPALPMNGHDVYGDKDTFSNGIKGAGDGLRARGSLRASQVQFYGYRGAGNPLSGDLQDISNVLNSRVEREDREERREKPRPPPVVVDLASGSPTGWQLSRIFVNAVLMLVTALTVTSLPLAFLETKDIVLETKSTVTQEQFPWLVLGWVGPLTGVVCGLYVGISYTCAQNRPVLPSGAKLFSCFLMLVVLLASYSGYAYCLGYVFYGITWIDEPAVWGVVCVGGTALGQILLALRSASFGTWGARVWLAASVVLLAGALALWFA